jgi:hypothetical protein
MGNLSGLGVHAHAPAAAVFSDPPSLPARRHTTVPVLLVKRSELTVAVARRWTEK